MPNIVRKESITLRKIEIRLLLAFLICLPSVAFSDEMSDRDLLMASYDTVWQTINENHYDSTFGGLDWNEVYGRYGKLVAGADSDDGFIEIVRKMLLELKLSHYAVFQLKDKVRSGSPTNSGGTVGIDIRVLDDKAIVKSVQPDLPAAQAGLRAGYTIESIDGSSVDQIIEDAKAEQLDFFNERRRLNNISDDVLNRFFGDPETSVLVTYRDESNALHEVTMLREGRTGKTILDEELPPFYIDFEAKLIGDNIGYIYFNAFIPPVEEQVIGAIDSMFDMRGLIIDIRGNPGGSHVVGEAIASKLVSQETLFSIFKYRDTTEEVVIQPDEKPFTGPVVVMIDVMNGSASERFSGCIQSIGRAVVVGERSPGIVGPSNLKRLPNGVSFMYLIAQSLTPDGTVLEGHGVIPDITVELDRAGLLSGVDTQIERAVEYIEEVSR